MIDRECKPIEYVSFTKRPLSERTREAYRADYRHYEMVFGGRLPATAYDLIRYLTEFRYELSANTLKRRLSSVAKYAKDRGYKDETKDFGVALLLRSIMAENVIESEVKKKLSELDFQKICNALSRKSINNSAESIKHVRDLAIFLLKFRCQMSSYNCASITMDNFRIERSCNEAFLRIFIPASDNFAKSGREWKIYPQSSFCPVKAIINWRDLGNIQSGPLFRAVNRHGNISERGLHGDSMGKILLNAFSEAGLNGKEYSFNSSQNDLGKPKQCTHIFDLYGPCIIGVKMTVL